MQSTSTVIIGPNRCLTSTSSFVFSASSQSATVERVFSYIIGLSLVQARVRDPVEPHWCDWCSCPLYTWSALSAFAADRHFARDCLCVFKPQLAIGRLRLHASTSICLSVCLSVANMQENAIFSKTKQFRAMVSTDDLWEIVHRLFKEPIIGPLISKMAEICYLENRHDVIFLPWAIRFGQNFSNWCRITCRRRWYGRNRNRKWNSNMANV